MKRASAAMVPEAPRSSLSRDITVMALGTAVSQAIGVLAAPILTRLYTPVEFGQLAVFVGMASMIATVGTFRYHLAVVLPQRDEESDSVVFLSLVVLCVVAVLSAFLVLNLGEFLASALNAPQLEAYLWLLPLGVLVPGMYDVFNTWSLRTGAMALVSATKVTRSAGLVIGQLAAYPLGTLGLLLGHIIGGGIGVLYMAAISVARRPSLIFGSNPARLWATAVRYRDFPIYSTWAGLFNAMGTHITPILFAALFDSALAGLYALAHRVIGLPSTLLGSAVSDAFYPAAARAAHTGALPDLITKLHEKLARIAMPPALFLFIAAPELFGIVFGEQWGQAGDIVRWLSLMLYVQFIASPISRVIVILERQLYGLVLQTTLLVARLGGLALGAWLGGFPLAVILYGIGSCIGYLLYIIVIAVVSGQPPASIWMPTLRTAPVAVALVMPSAAAWYLALDSWAFLGASAATAALIGGYYLMGVSRNVVSAS